MGGGSGRDHDLGTSLKKSARRRYRTRTGSSNHSVEFDDGPDTGRLVSIVDQSDLADFLQVASLANADFTAERVSPIIVSDAPQPPVHAEKSTASISPEEALRIPRRPAYHEGMTAKEFQMLEQKAFLEWRRDIAATENSGHFILTPFERNIEIWRQLWRVVDACKIMVQIVDARNPLLFYCPDLDQYVKECSREKEMVLLINKADFLSPEQRRIWSDYLASIGLDHLFYSALEVHGDNDGDGEDSEDDDEEDSEDDDDEGSEDDGGKEPGDNDGENSEGKQDGSAPDTTVPTAAAVQNRSDILSSAQLVDYLRDRCRGAKVGMVGYPNVGKSSTINSLVGAKKVSVGATPGKTKHFQTIVIDKELTLCDCPGLVFPNFAASRAELVLAGVLPVDELRERNSSVELLISRIPVEILRHLYKYQGSATPTASQLLSAFAASRGFRTAFHGNPDESRAARIILKDYVSGKLKHCTGPPGIENFMSIADPQLELEKSMALRRKKTIAPLTEAEPDEFLTAKGAFVGNAHVSFTTGTSHGGIRGAAPLRAMGKKHYKGR